MKKIQLRELFRTICRSPISFLSIIVVTALGVVSFCGISFSSAAVTNMGEEYYSNVNFYDLKLFSSSGFNEADIDELSEIEGITDVFAGYVTHELALINGENLVAEIFTQSPTINVSDIKEGRFPFAPNECTIELPLAKKFNLKIGDTFSLASNSNSLYKNEFVIVGIAELPLVLCKDDYYNRGISVLGDGQVDTLIIVDDSAFNPDVFIDKPLCYMTTDSEASVFSKEYIDDQKNIQKRIKALGKVREKDKFNARQSEYESKLAQAKNEYQAGLDAYNAAMIEYSVGKSKLELKDEDLKKIGDSLNIAKAKNQLAQVKEQINSLDYKYAELAEKELQLKDARAQLDEAKIKLEELERIEQNPYIIIGLLSGKGNSDTLNYEAAEQLLAIFSEENENGTYIDITTIGSRLKSYNESMRFQYEEGEKKYAEGLEQYNAGESALEDAKRELMQAEDSLVSGISSAQSLLIKTNDGLGQIEKGFVTLSEKKAELDNAQEQLNKGKKIIQDIEKVIANISLASWTVTGVDSNPSFHNFTTNLNGMDSVVFTCCVLLLLIATMVCYTTIGRMVSQQRRLIGTQKALGLKPSEIYVKYIVYALLSTSLGVLLGVTIAYLFMQNIIFDISYSAAYQAVNFVPAFEIAPVLIITLGSLACSTIAAVLSSYQLVRENAVTLLNDGTRNMKHRSTSKKSRFSLGFLMAFRNILANKKILITTLVGVAGCTILLIVTFTVRAGMAGITQRQYKELQHYDGTVAINSQTDIAEQEKLRNYIESSSSFDGILVCERYNSFLKDGEYHYAAMISSDDPDLTEYIRLIDVETGDNMAIPERGVLISKKCAEEYGYTIGDDFVITNSTGVICTAFVAGIFDRNIGNAFVLNSEYYSEISGEHISFNQYFINLNQTNKDDFASELNNYKAFVSYTPADLYVDEFNYKLTCIDNAVSVILIVAFLISVFVLLNLAIMNINQKETEITVMKALGFSGLHIQLYVLREVMLMSIIGLFVGVLIGAPTGAYITQAIELEGIQNIRGINLSACLISVVICSVFFTVTNILSLIKIRNIKMTGATRQA